MSIVIELPEAQSEKVRTEARRLGVEPGELARALVTDLLSREGADFSAAAEHVLRKNERLYQRLA